jgi:hypothetical protein
MNRPKKQGTAAETRVVNLHIMRGIGARRLSEGGVHDKGDVEILYLNEGNPDLIVGEVKDRERLNAPEALEKAMRKSGTYRTALFWSQPVRGGLVRRRRRVVVISESLWLELIGGSHGS